MLKIAIGLGVAIAIAAGVVVGLVKRQDRPFLDPPTVEFSIPPDEAAPVPEGGDEPAPQDGAGPEPETGDDPAPQDGAGPEPESTEPGADPEAESETHRILPGSLLLIDATATVSGFGAGSAFSMGELVDPDVDPDIRSFEQVTASCAVPGTLVLRTTGSDVVAEYETNAFTAGFRFDANNHVSIGATTDEAGHFVVVGGYSNGSEGRGNSEQWAIGDGALGLDWQIANVDGVATFIVNAHWSGASIENFTGEESNGIVDIRCVFFELPPSDL